ncbi:YpdA family putative bacillithiol disulfide reductase [Marinicrinis sediminis]|uniref:YpdA family putative bacillithiol disulfide reductase n=1 Tax=Marinicrinis sediminis TaxID=1652465 RepID=A0ABW5RET0_9BACL
MEQVIIVGGGPCGIAAAIACKQAGFDPLVIEKGSIVQSIYQYPTYLVFHSTSENLEIGNYPFMSVQEKPTRQEALQYYRTVAEREQLRVHTYEKVIAVNRDEKGFKVETKDRFGKSHAYRAQNLIMATGYFDHPNHLGIPGEDLLKVSHFYQEAHPYHQMKVAVIGGKNSAIDAALDLLRVGAEVTVIYRQDQLSPSVKAWVRPVFESMVDKGKIHMLWNTEVTRITAESITVKDKENERTIENDFVLALTGFRPDRAFLENMGVQLDEQHDAPLHDPETMETNVPGLYIAGVIAAGREANAIFIENGRHHGSKIARHMLAK